MDDLRLREGLVGVNVTLWGLLEAKERSRLEDGRLRCGVRGECGMLWGHGCDNGRLEVVFGSWRWHQIWIQPSNTEALFRTCFVVQCSKRSSNSSSTQQGQGQLRRWDRCMDDGQQLKSDNLDLFVTTTAS